MLQGGAQSQTVPQAGKCTRICEVIVVQKRKRNRRGTLLFMSVPTWCTRKIMTVRSRFRAVIALAGVAVAWGGFAQSSRIVSIDSSGGNGLVNLSLVDAGAQHNFAKIFEIPMYQEYQPYALLLTNTSGQAIVAVTIRWTGTSADGSGVYDSSTDSLGLQVGAGSGMSMAMPIPGQGRRAQVPARFERSWASAYRPAVMASGEHMLAAPGLFVREDVTGQRASAGGSSSIPDALKAAEMISATLDAVVLEDGKVLGPDASHTVDELRARKAAIDSVVKAVAAAEQSGHDGVEALHQLADARPTRESGPEIIRQIRIAHTLMMSRAWKEQLEKMAAIQLPNFHR